LFRSPAPSCPTAAIPIATTLATRVGARLVLMSSLVEPAAVEREVGLE
jgi:hypothetical protein